MKTDMRMRFLSTRVVMLVLALCTTACNAAPQDAVETPAMRFSIARVRLVSGADTTHLRVELASTSEQQTMGLMERPRLADSAGMLFLYRNDQPANAGFWMFRTRIPLDIAFLDSLGVIVAIKSMIPCTSTLAAGCPSYPPDAPYRAALEVNAGYFARHRVAIGSRVILSDTSRVVHDSSARPDTGRAPALPDSEPIAVKGPTLVVFFVGAYAVADSGGEDVEALGDLEYHLGSARPALDSLGVTVYERYGRDVRYLLDGRRDVFTPSADSGRAGYLFLRPRHPVQVHYGILTDMDLPRVARTRLQLPAGTGRR